MNSQLFVISFNFRPNFRVTDANSFYRHGYEIGSVRMCVGYVARRECGRSTRRGSEQGRTCGRTRGRTRGGPRGRTRVRNKRRIEEDQKRGSDEESGVHASRDGQKRRCDEEFGTATSGSGPSQEAQRFIECKYKYKVEW